jgi:uncharacterized protein (TIGR00269 family)
MFRCDKCNKRAIISQRYSGMHLCRDHFHQDVHRKVRETLRQTKIFGRGARIAVAMGGDRNSAVLLYIVKDLFSRRRDIEFAAVLIDEGLSGYSFNRLRCAKDLADRLDVPYFVRSFKDVFGITADQMASQLAFQNHGLSICMFCRGMRDALLNRTALEMGADALAIGHGLDHEAQIIFQCYLRGDMGQLFKIKTDQSREGLIARIKPLMRIPQREISLYFRTQGLCSLQTHNCPFSGDVTKRVMAKALIDFEHRHPGTKYSLLRSMERVIDLLPENVDQEREVKAKPLSGGKD